jgi:murein biosynthesis integral membrane protein MurJ
MTWPMHDAEPTAAESRAQRRGRHAAPAPMPPQDGFTPGGGGPTPAETTMPLTLNWGTVAPPAPAPARPPRPEDFVRPRYPAAQPPRPPRKGPPRPPGPPKPEAGPRRRSLIGSSAGMAVGTLVSRGTGFVRTLVLVYALGSGFVGNAYNTANNLPNTVYYLMLGGVFTSVIVPLLVRAANRDPDHGEAYAQRIFTLGAITLLGVTVLATALAAPIVLAYGGGGITGNPRNAMIIWSYWFMPQIFFYGMSSLIGAVLNTRGSFAAPMWTPAINNIAVIAIGGLYIADGLNGSSNSISSGGVELLAIGTTAGLVLQTACLFPSLRRVGFRWRPQLGFQPGELGEIRRMAGWMSAYVVTQWAGTTVVTILANHASKTDSTHGYTAYATGWQLFQLPYAIIGISVITAILPRMSEHANIRRYSLVRNDFSTGVRLASVIIVPAAIYLAVLGGPLAEFLLAHGKNETVGDAQYIGLVFGLLSLGLIPYMLTQLQLRIFYSFQDSRMAALIGLFTMTVGIIGDLIVLATMPAGDVVAGMAVVYGLSNLVGAITGWIILLLRVGSLDGWSVTRSLARMHLAAVPGLIFILVVMYGLGRVLQDPGRVYGLAVTVVGGGGAILLYAVCARKLRVAEFGFLMRTIAGRFGGQSSRH